MSKKHSGDIDEAKIVDEVKHTIFERYTLLPDRFMELLETDITPPCVQEAAVALRDAQQAVMQRLCAKRHRTAQSPAPWKPWHRWRSTQAGSLRLT